MPLWPYSLSRAGHDGLIGKIFGLPKPCGPDFSLATTTLLVSLSRTPAIAERPCPKLPTAHKLQVAPRQVQRVLVPVNHQVPTPWQGHMLRQDQEGAPIGVRGGLLTGCHGIPAAKALVEAARLLSGF